MTFGEERRRFARIPSELPVSLTLRDGLDGPTLVGPEFGALSDISAGGARLTVLQIHYGNYHLVYTPQEDRSKVLILKVYLSEDQEHFFSIIAKPAWFNAATEESEFTSYVIGVEFVPPPDEEEAKRFNKMVSEQAAAGGHWWTEVFSRLWPDRD